MCVYEKEIDIITEQCVSVCKRESESKTVRERKRDIKMHEMQRERYIVRERRERERERERAVLLQILRQSLSHKMHLSVLMFVLLRIIIEMFQRAIAIEFFLISQSGNEPRGRIFSHARPFYE